MSIPGYCDLQVNGYQGVDFTSPSLTEDDVLRITEALLAAGTYAYLPTVITSPMELYSRNLPIIAKAVSKHGLEAHVLGIHLEGPFISSRPGAVGAHNPAWVMDAAPEFLDALMELSEGRVRLLTVAAEVPRIEALIRHAVAKRIAVSLGHQLPGREALANAAKAGARVLTHFGNGLPNQIDRHENPLWAGLANDSLSAMLITDGHHLPADLIKCVLRVKGVGGTIVVSDSSAPAGLPPGRYNVLGNDALLESNGRLHNPAKGCLVGSSFTMRQCMDHLRSLNLLSEEELDEIGYHNPMNLLETSQSF